MRKARFISIPFDIIRDPETGKKLYICHDTKEKKIVPCFSSNWENLPDADNNSRTIALIPYDEYVVLDCDSKEHSELIYNLLKDKNHCIVESDKGYYHFYFKQTEYFRESLLFHTSRKRVEEIDIMQGKCLVFAPSKGNKTKKLIQGDIYNPLEIPPEVIEVLEQRYKKIKLVEKEYEESKIISYLAPIIQRYINAYELDPSWETIKPLFKYITPEKFKPYVEPDLHPDRIPDGLGTPYLQAVASKLGRDESITFEQTQKILFIITQKLWSRPYPIERLQKFLDYLPKQKYEDGSPVFRYNPNLSTKPLVSINNSAFVPFYRTIDDEYVFITEKGSLEIIKGSNNFKKALFSSNYLAVIGNMEIKTNKAFNKMLEIIETVRLINNPKRPSGLFIENNIKYFNTYRTSKYLKIIRNNKSPLELAKLYNNEIREKETYYNKLKGKNIQIANFQKSINTPAINTLLLNITRDNEDPEKLIWQFERFLARKLKLLDYSPLVFQLNGVGGTGKSLFAAMLEELTKATKRIYMQGNPSRFNAEMEGALFVFEDEGIINKQVANKVKELSGNKTIRIEKKGKDPYEVENLLTIIISSNTTKTLAEFIHDRRVVLFSSFSSPNLIDLIDPAEVFYELEEYARYLATVKPLTNLAYHNAIYWQDNILKETFEEKFNKKPDRIMAAEAFHLAEKLAYILAHLSDYTPLEFKDELLKIFPSLQYAKVKSELQIPLYKEGLIRIKDRQPVLHHITLSLARQVGLGNLIKEDKNMKKYNKRYHKLCIPLPKKYLNVFANSDLEDPDTNLELLSERIMNPELENID